VPRDREKRKRSAEKPYWLVSRFYDEMWPSRTNAWKRARQKLLGPVLKYSKTICDLGCGTGSNSVEFARRGLKVYSLDLSADMCRATREKARKKRVEVWVKQADMREFRLPQPVDCIVSEWGPINHLRKKTDLLKVARAAARALRPGGYFYFDLHRPRFFEDWEKTVVFENRRYLLVKQGGYSRQLQRGWAEFTFFIPAPRGRWTRHTDFFIHIHWTHAQVLQALRRAGFNSIRLFDFNDFDVPPSSRPSESSRRTMYLARKQKAENS